jgi:cell volume regulation protein A
VIFGEFTFAGQLPLGKVAKFYGFSIGEAEREVAIADCLRARLHRKPTLRDRIRFGDISFVIQDMEGEQITKIGFELEPREPGSPA